jgi:hypothetical protein
MSDISHHRDIILVADVRSSKYRENTKYKYLNEMKIAASD